MKIKIAVSNNVRDNFPSDITITKQDFLKLLTDHQTVTTKTEAKGFIAGHFNGKQRKTENLQFRTLITLDIDHASINLTELEVILKTDLSYYEYCAYSTASHTLNEPKIRVVLFLDKDVSCNEYKIIATNFIDTLRGIRPYTDIKASTTPCQLMLLPFKPNNEYVPWFKINEGVLVVSDQFASPANIIENIKKPVTKDSFDNLVKNSPLTLNRDEVIAYLKLYALKSCDYHDWLEVGMSLHHQFEGRDEGRDIWHKWSLKYKNSDANLDSIKYKWSTFSTDGGDIKTFASIIRKVKAVKKDRLPINKGVLPICKSTWEHTKGKNLNPLSTTENYKILLENYNIKVNYDEILKRVNIYFNGEISTDDNNAITAIKSLCELNGLKVAFVSEMISMLANNNKINSWRDIILSHSSAKTDNFDRLCASIVTAPEHEHIKRVYLKKWLLQMIHMTCLNDAPSPKSARLVLVFQGKQGVGKTSWFRSLVSADKSEYAIDGMSINVANSMDVMSCITHVFVELGEVGATFRKSDTEHLKAFISAPTDVLNIKYIPKPVKYRRRTVFFGSVNDKKFLQDSTGSSRFLVLPIISCDARHNINMFDLYAELLEEAKLDVNYDLSTDETTLQIEHNSLFETVDTLKEKFEEVFDITKTGAQICNATKVLELLGFSVSNIKKNQANDMARILDDYNFNKSTKPRGWLIPPLKSNSELM